jgi:hypothetical protein
MTKFYLLTETESTAAEARPVQIQSAVGTRPDNCRDLLPGDKRQPASARGV